MNQNKKLVEALLSLRLQQNDIPVQFCVRNKASPLEKWSHYFPYSNSELQKFYTLPIDGFRFKFKYSILTINGRHKTL